MCIFVITKFKLFESEEKEISFILNDIIDYFDNRQGYINSFISSLCNNRDIIVKINCKNCTHYNEYGADEYFHSNKVHKGKINGYGLGSSTDDGKKRLHLTLYLKRIKYKHEVDTSKPITIYGEISPSLQETINNINAKRTSIKYNI
jgi:hypothetical protein